MTYACGIVLYDRASQADVEGARQALAAALNPRDGRPLFEVSTVGRIKERVALEGGEGLLPDHIYPDGHVYDVILVPGGPGAAAALEHVRMIQWLGRAGRAAQMVGAAGAGVALLRAAGLLPEGTPAVVPGQGKVLLAPAGEALAQATVGRLGGGAVPAGQAQLPVDGGRR
jgi:transcriptional regulator GlxA family with amidase domain